MAWKKLITEDDFAGFAAPATSIGGAVVARSPPPRLGATAPSS